HVQGLEGEERGGGVLGAVHGEGRGVRGSGERAAPAGEGVSRRGRGGEGHERSRDVGPAGRGEAHLPLARVVRLQLVEAEYRGTALFVSVHGEGRGVRGSGERAAPAGEGV